MNKEELMLEALKARKNSYSPYSNFTVGACVLTKDNKLYYGANIENASYSLTMCAERNAIFNAYSNGAKKDDIIAIAIVTKTKEVASPCGACRQVLSELLPSDAKIYLGNVKGDIKTTSVDSLLPHRFLPSYLK